MNYNPSRTEVVTANGRNYRMPNVPTVVVCIDGSEPGYIERAIEQGLAPNFARLMAEGANLTALSVIPSFTNPNNISIITGRPPARARHRRQLLLRPGHAPGSDDERRAIPARADHHAGVPRSRREGRGRHRQGQAAHAARQWPRLRERPRHRVLLRAGRQGDARRQRHRRTCSTRVGMPLPDVYSARPLRVRHGGRRLAAQARAARPDVPVDHRLRAAQGGARHADWRTTSTP